MDEPDARTRWPALGRLAHLCERNGLTVTAMGHIPRLVVRLNPELELLIDRPRKWGLPTDGVYHYRLYLRSVVTSQNGSSTTAGLRQLGELTEAGARILLTGETLAMLRVNAVIQECTVQWHRHDPLDPQWSDTCRFEED